uniref:CSD domain-containing protein n=1 Tax=Entomoneis paludosa TaxID=265537 RepID=A0A7S2VCA4_9STRA
MTTAATGCLGTVKWFSNKKGFGFIAPTSDNTPTSEEIFVHQTGIVTDGQFRTLQENGEVKFDVEKEEETGKLKAVNVTNVDGTPIVPPPRQPRRPRNKAEEGGEETTPVEEDGEAPKNSSRRNNNKGKSSRNNNNKTSDDTKSTPRDPPFHAKLSDELKGQIESQTSLALTPHKTTVDVALGDHTRIKLGQGGYAGICLASPAMIGEGHYECTELGVVRFSWARSIKFLEETQEWTVADAADLLNTFSLMDDSVGPVQADETAAKLWGGEKPDPKEAFEANGFQMRRVVLTRPPNNRYGRGGGGRGRNNNNKKEGEAPPVEGAL